MNAPMTETASIIEGLARGVTVMKALKPVYPFYLASRAKRGLLTAAEGDSEKIIASVGDIKTIGDCRYAIPVTDVHGQGYRIIVEVQ